MRSEPETTAQEKTRDRVRRYRERKRKGNELVTQRISPSAIRLALEEPVERVHYPIRIPVIPKGVAPHGVTPQVAMDSEPAYECARLAMDAGPQFSSQLYAYSNIEGFPGYPYLMLLALRSEYRNMATALATELTRKWIKFNSTDTEDESTKTKITEIEQAFTALGIQGIIRKAAEHDAFYGTGQILINIKGADLKTPLIIDPRTVKKDSLIGFKNVDPIWTTPLMYNSLTPSRPDFYKPDSWWVMGEHWDASRIIVTVTREVPDIFKPAFNFSGMSLSQLAEPYVNNWLRTRQSVSDLINNFSVLVLKTAMDQVLTGGDDGSNLFSRIKLFTATRSNKGVMVLDKDREELEQLAVPLGGLHELQSQALEQLCVVSREPATVLTGITPSGFGNVAEGEVRIWYDYIHAQQEAHWRSAIDKMFKIVQVSMYGEIDPEITFEFVPLYEMTEEQESTIRVNDSIRAGNLIDRGIIDAQEERERLARDPESGYQGIDISKEIAPPDEEEESANLARGTDSALGMDADFVESEHPREDDGKFSSGGGGASSSGGEEEWAPSGGTQITKSIVGKSANPGGVQGYFDPAKGGILFHGSSNPRKFKSGSYAYTTAEYDEAKGFAQNVHRLGEPVKSTAAVMHYAAKPGKTVDIDDDILDMIMNGSEEDEPAIMQAARKSGARYAVHSHPSGVKGKAGEFDAIISLYPDEDLKSKGGFRVGNVAAADCELTRGTA